MAGEQADVGIEPDTGPREVAVPADLAEALARDDMARASFDGMSFTHRKAETRATRLAKTVASLHAGRRVR